MVGGILSAMRRRRCSVALLLVLAALALAPAARAQTDCTIPGQNLFVRNTLEEFYLWYRELPDTNSALFPSPEAYLDAVRYRVGRPSTPRRRRWRAPGGPGGWHASWR